MTTQLEASVDFAEYIASHDYAYSQADGRCDPIHSGHADCSGLAVASARWVGVDLPCTGSFALAQMCHAAGTGITFEEACERRGSLFFLGIREGQGGVPGRDPGHVAIGRGRDVRERRTVEARNRRAGILFGPVDGRNWTYCAMPPWLRGAVPITTPPPVVAPEEDDEDMLKPTDVTSSLTNQWGSWQQTADGGIITLEGKFYGNFLGLKPEKRRGNHFPFVALSNRKDGKEGYMQTCRDRAYYQHGPDTVRDYVEAP